MESEGPEGDWLWLGVGDYQGRTMTEDDKVQVVPSLTDHQHGNLKVWVPSLEFLGPGNLYLNGFQVALMTSQHWESLACRGELGVGEVPWSDGDGHQQV